MKDEGFIHGTRILLSYTHFYGRMYFMDQKTPNNVFQIYLLYL